MGAVAIPGPKILDRYTAREFMWPFLGCVAGFTVILVSTLLFELTNLIFVKKVAVGTVLDLLVYKLPAILVITLPIAVLFGTLLALGRMAKDCEMTVMRSIGVSFDRIIIPVLLFAMVISLVAYLVNEWVVPWANHQYESTIRRIAFSDGPPTLQENIFFRTGDNRIFYIHHIDQSTQQMRSVMVYELSVDGFPRLVTAKTGVYKNRVWQLQDVVVRTFNADGFVESESKSDTMTIRVKENIEDFFGNQKTTEEMSRKELKQNIELFRQSGVSVQQFEVDYHIKLALPLSSFIFALLGAPLSLRSARSGRFFGVTVSIVVTFIYYVAISVSRSLGAIGVIPALPSAWLPNVLFLSLGSVLIYRAERRWA